MIRILTDKYSRKYSRRSLMVVCWLIRRKARVRISSDIKKNMKKIFLRRLPLSGFLAKPLRVNKIAKKKTFFLKKSVVRCRR